MGALDARGDHDHAPRDRPRRRGGVLRRARRVDRPARHRGRVRNRGDGRRHDHPRQAPGQPVAAARLRVHPVVRLRSDARRRGEPGSAHPGAPLEARPASGRAGDA